MSVGDICWVELPEMGGREQQGRRPAIVMQEDGYSTSLPTLLVIPLSSARAALRFPGTTLVRATLESGLRTDSVALVFQLRAIDRKRIGLRLGTANRQELSEIFEELRKLTGMER